MTNTYQIYLISDSTGETLDRIFTAIKAQFKNINYKNSIKEALVSLDLKENDIAIITGSLYLAGEVLNLN